MSLNFDLRQDKVREMGMMANQITFKPFVYHLEVLSETLKALNALGHT